MRSYEEARSRALSLEKDVAEISENFAFERALCLMSDPPWSEFRVLLTTRDRVLRAADRAVFSFCGGQLADMLVNAETVTEATVWQAACRQLDTSGLFCAWPTDDAGQARFLRATSGLNVEREARLLVNSIPHGQNSGRPWKAYESENLERAVKASRPG